MIIVAIPSVKSFCMVMVMNTGLTFIIFLSSSRTDRLIVGDHAPVLFSYFSKSINVILSVLCHCSFNDLLINLITNYNFSSLRKIENSIENN
jgi:hypothetical protein